MQKIFSNGKLSVGIIQTYNKDATYCHKNVKTPDAGHQVKHAQLTGLVELGVLALGEVETPVHLLQGNPNATRSREHITVSTGDTSALSAQRGSIAAMQVSGTGEDSRFYLWLL